MLPILGALVLQAAYGAVDLLVVGRFGSTSGLSAVSTGSQVLNLVTFVVTQLAMGVTVLIARYLGEKRPQYIGQVIGGQLLCSPFWQLHCSWCWCFCTAYFQSDAGSCRSPEPDRQLCAHLRQRHLLYCNL